MARRVASWASGRKPTRTSPYSPQPLYAPQALAKSPQAAQGAIAALPIETAVRQQAGRKAHGLAETIDDVESAIVRVGDHEVEAVGADIDRGDGSICHGWPRPSTDGCGYSVRRC